MQKAGQTARLGRTDWVKAGLRALAQGGIRAVKVEALAREIGTTKGSFYWHFKDLTELHDVMLELWEQVATTAITAHVRRSGLDPMAQLRLLVEMVSIRPDDALGGVAIEPALREWGRTDDRARAVVQRVDGQRLADLEGFLAAVGVPAPDLALKSQLIYAAVIGFESLRLTTETDMAPALWRLVTGLLPEGPQSGK